MSESQDYINKQDQGEVAEHSKNDPRCFRLAIAAIIRVVCSKKRRYGITIVFFMLLIWMLMAVALLWPIFAFATYAWHK